jgi:hypothetical protein
MVRRALWTVAFLIGVAAVIDPEIASNRATKPELQLVVEEPQDAGLADRVDRALSKRFTISRSPVAGASGAVVVGDRPPSDDSHLPMPSFAVLPDKEQVRATIERVGAPREATTDGRVPIFAVAHVAGSRGRNVDLTLRAGNVVVDRASRAIASDEEHIDVPLTYVPTSAATTPLSLTISDDGRTATADVALDVSEKRWAVLFFDARPSWMSTFVRRALERDPRFVVTSRTVTSRNVSTDAGTPPGRLDDLATLSLYDAIVVGAPEALTSTDVAGLEAFLRRRGGGVAFVLDARAAGPYERLLGISGWSAASPPKPESVAVAGVTAMVAGELAWPSPLPRAAQPISDGTKPVIWRAPVGIGTAIVSGALDAWRFRDPTVSTFDRFWQRQIAELAAAAIPPLALRASNNVVRPGEQIDITAVLRSTSATTEPAGSIDSTQIRFWPTGTGRYGATLRAPDSPGTYRVKVTANGEHAELPLVVLADARHAQPSAPDVLAAWTESRGGSALTAAQLGQLESAVAAALPSAPRIVLWHPMQSGWWVIPFAFALSAEWWLRRRRGLR